MSVEYDFGAVVKHCDTARRAYLSLARADASEPLRPLWAEHFREATERYRQANIEFEGMSVTLASHEAHVLQSLANRLGDELVANFVDAVGDYRRMSDDERDTALKAFFAEYDDEHDDLVWTMILAIADRGPRREHTHGVPLH